MKKKSQKNKKSRKIEWKKRRGKTKIKRRKVYEKEKKSDKPFERK